MQLLCDKEIIELVNKHNIISPFYPSTVRLPNHISHGLGSAHYDVRLDNKVKLFKNTTLPADPLNFHKSIYNDVTINNGYIIMPPHSFMLGSTIEHFNVPNNIFIMCTGKSTYARCGIIVNVTCILPGMKGNIVLELSNTSTTPVKVYVGEKHGIATFLFHKINECNEPYNGRYQMQDGIITPHANSIDY